MQDATNEEAARTAPTEKPHHTIIGVGASAGGLEALEQFFKHIPDNFAHSFVVVQHLSPSHKSMMAELLSKYTSRPVHEVHDDTDIHPGNIYVLAPGKTITLCKHRLLLADRQTDKGLNLPINIFFSSLAREQGENAIGVVLSGTGSDGTIGLREIKQVGGLALAQSPETAAFNGMPQSAISSGYVDDVLPPWEFSNRLSSYLSSDLAKPIDVLEGSYTDILQLLYNHTNVDFTIYKSATLMRRLQRRMLLREASSITEYHTYLKAHPSEVKLLHKDFLVGVTQFFRDKEMWTQLTNEVLPDLIAQKGMGDSLRCWVAGCSSGEEAYTLGMLLDQACRQTNKRIDIKIFATDLESGNLEQANQGYYPNTIANDVPQRLLETYFADYGDNYKATPYLRGMMIFSQHNGAQDPPFGRMDLVFCRNLLIYLQPKAQERMLYNLHFALRDMGYLVLGASESLGPAAHAFETLSKRWRIYQKIAHSKLLRPKQIKRPNQPIKSKTQKKRHQTPISSQLYKHLLQRVGGISLVVDEQLNVRDAFGPYKKLLDIPEESFSLSLKHMLPPSISTPLLPLIYKATRTHQAEHLENIKWPHEGQEHLISASVFPNETQEEEGTQLYQVLLLPTTGGVPFQSPDPLTEGSLHEALQHELDAARETLQHTTNELQASNEELQASNEELQSTNEELQSTNEELQSLNEELHTVNTEHQHRLVEIQELNEDLENLLSSSEIGTIFLDKEFNIRKFTPAISRLFRIRKNDEGRPLSHFATQLQPKQIETLYKEAKETLKTGSTYEETCQTKDGTHVIQKVNPYISRDGSIEGVVLSFVDISNLTEAQTQVTELSSKLESALEAAAAGTWSYDISARAFTCDRAFAALFGLAPSQSQLSLSEWKERLHTEDRERAHTELQRAIRRGQRYSSEYRILRAGELKYLRVSGKVEHSEEGLPTQLIGVSHDMTEQLSRQYELKQLQNLLHVAKRTAQLAEWRVNLTTGETHWSDEFYRMCGLEPGSIPPNAENGIAMIHPDDRPLAEAAFAKTIEEGSLYDVKKRIIHPDGSAHWVLSRGAVVEDEQTKEQHLVGHFLDIDKAHRAELEREYFFNNSSDLQAIGDMEGNLRQVNDAWTKILGWHRDELVGQNMIELLYEDDIERTINEMGALLQGEQIQGFENRYKTKDGGFVWLSWNSKTLPEANLNIGSARDITKEKQITESLTRTIEELTSANLALENFAYAVSHDLREPLNTISNFAGLFEKKYQELVDERGTRMLGYMSEATNRMKTLVQALLDYSRINENVLNPENIPAEELLQHVRADLAFLSEQTEADITVALPPESQIYGDAVLLRQLISNLIHNAIKYRKPNEAPKIHITLEQDDKSVTLSIKDEGIGIPEKFHKRIFELFRRLHAKDKHGGGIGMGLTICQRIIHLHGGKLWLTSTEGESTTFFVNLPKAPKEQKQ